MGPAGTASCVSCPSLSILLKRWRGTAGPPEVLHWFPYLLRPVSGSSPPLPSPPLPSPPLPSPPLPSPPLPPLNNIEGAGTTNHEMTFDPSALIKNGLTAAKNATIALLQPLL